MAQTGIDLGLFKVLAFNENKQWNMDELVQETGAEPALLRTMSNYRSLEIMLTKSADRILRCLAAYGMVTQNNDNTYSASNITRNLTVPGTHAGIKH
jgi:demethylsterigmatocystin 6-O-methyltransferase